MAEEKLRGKLPLINGNQLQLEIALNRKNEPIMFQADCGCSYTQTSQDKAHYFGLKSHPSLLGRSLLGDGQTKNDYLCPALISILGVEAAIVVKVAPDQPSLLGLDAMFLFDMELHIVKGQFSIAPKAIAPMDSPFHFLEMGSILKKLGIPPSDLVPVETLPPPDVSYKQLVSAGKSNCVIDLGTSFASTTVARPRTVQIIDLGCSN
jgi:hypothetical protein